MDGLEEEEVVEEIMYKCVMEKTFHLFHWALINSRAFI